MAIWYPTYDDDAQYNKNKEKNEKESKKEETLVARMKKIIKKHEMKERKKLCGRVSVGGTNYRQFSVLHHPCECKRMKREWKKCFLHEHTDEQQLCEKRKMEKLTLPHVCLNIPRKSKKNFGWLQLRNRTEAHKEAFSRAKLHNFILFHEIVHFFVNWVVIKWISSNFVGFSSN